MRGPSHRGGIPLWDAAVPAGDPTAEAALAFAVRLATLPCVDVLVGQRGLPGHPRWGSSRVTAMTTSPSGFRCGHRQAMLRRGAPPTFRRGLVTFVTYA
jgi:hypothetical protein